jgi:hypothetical protein
LGDLAFVFDYSTTKSESKRKIEFGTLMGQIGGSISLQTDVLLTTDGESRGCVTGY